MAERTYQRENQCQPTESIAEKWKAHCPHKGDEITVIATGKLLGIVSHVEDRICWLENGDCFIWAFRDGLNKIQHWKRKDVYPVKTEPRRLTSG